MAAGPTLGIGLMDGACRKVTARIPLQSATLTASPREKRLVQYTVGEKQKERNGELTNLARKLRKNQTKEEALLWHNFLSKAPVRFHRQYVIGNYIVDFYCHKAKLVIELDGSQHYEESGKTADEKRDVYLRSLGLTVLRYSNADVDQRFDSVCEDIWNHL